MCVPCISDFTNLSDTTFTTDEIQTLNKGYKFAVNNNNKNDTLKLLAVELDNITHNHPSEDNLRTEEN